MGRPHQRGTRRRPRCRHRGARPRHRPFGSSPNDAQPAHDRRGSRRRRHRPSPRRVLQPTLAGASTRRGTQRRPVRNRRPVPQRPADDEPDRRSDRRPHRADRADLPAERKGAAVDVGARRLGRERPRSVPGPRYRRPAARRHPHPTGTRRAGHGAALDPPSRRRSTPRTMPAGASPSTSCCACSSCSSAANARSRPTRSASSTRWGESSYGASTTPCRTS